jgi:hypothetical protein
MALLFLIILVAILIASIIKGAAKLAFKVIPIVFIAGVIFIGMSHQSTTPAAAVVQSVVAAVPAPATPNGPAVEQETAQDYGHWKPVDPDKLRADMARMAGSSGSPSRGALIDGAGAGVRSADTPAVELAATDWNDNADSHVEPGSASEWNEEDTKPSKKRGKSTRRAKAEAEPDATPTIREHVDEILDAPDPKAAVRAYADWLDELNEEMDKAAAEMDDQD